MVSKSFGINFQGLLLLSAWANNDKGLPLSDDFILGDLKNISFLEISKSKKFITTKKRLDENKGHCKIFSYTNGGRTFESIFTKTDPLYT